MELCWWCLERNISQRNCLIFYIIYFRPVFRSYEPQHESLKEAQLPRLKPTDGKCSISQALRVLHSTLRHAKWQELILKFLLWEGVVVLKEVILNSFYLGGCGGLERSDFEQFLLWEGVVVLKEVILNSFYFGRVWWSWKKWLWTVSTLGGCGGLERSDFEQFLLWEGVVVLKEVILNSFYFGRGVMILKEVILNSFYFERVWWSWKKWFWTVSTLGGCDDLERSDFEQFLLWEGVVVLKEVVLNSFYFGRVWCKCKIYMPLKKIRGIV